MTKAVIIDGPHVGKTYQVTYPPTRLRLPIWPEPDLDGPPYKYAVYRIEEASSLPPLRYKYVGTEDS